MMKSCCNCTHHKKRINQKPCRDCYGREFWEPMTVAQRIYVMPDEYLARCFADRMNRLDCYGCEWFGECDLGIEDCTKFHLKWLQQPYKEDTDETRKH